MKRIIIILILLALAGNASGAWYDTNYTYYKQIEINQTFVNDSIGNVNFPMLISGTDTDLRDHCQSDGDDIIFVNSANTSQLDHKIELWNSTIGEFVMWINISDIINVSSINMYYNYSSATNSEDSGGVWGDMIGVWLFNEGSGTWANDSASNDNNGLLINIASPPNATSGWNDSGVADGCLQFDGTNDYVNINATNAEPTNVSVSIDVKASSPGNYNHVFSKTQFSEGGSYAIYTGPNGEVYFYVDTGNFVLSPSGGNIWDGEWHNVIGNYDKSYVRLFVDGVECGSGTSESGNIEYNGGNITISYDSEVDLGYFPGKIDNVRVYNDILSSEKIATNYNNTNDPANFTTFGAEQEQSSAGTPNATSLTHTKGTTWVNHTWSAGTAPNVTDSYNCSVNSTWYNTTTTPYYNNTPITSGNWSNITVYAWNDTYDQLSSGSVSEDVQTDVVTEDPIFGSISTSVISNTSATILWECPTTAVKSQVEYGLTTSYGNTTTEKDFSYWRMTDITGLAEDTLYHYRIRTTDLEEGSVISEDYDFTTINSTVLDNIIKAARNDGLLAKTYYVATWGNDSTNDGLSLSTPWASPHHASITVDAGDTIWVVDGSYNTDFIPGVYDPGVDFGLNAGTGNGIAEAPIVMKAYNGTPEIAGDIEIRYDYVTMDGFITNGSYSHAFDVRYTEGVKLLNCTVNTSGTAADGIYMRDANYTTLKNFTVWDAGWNSYGFKPTSRLPTTGHHVILENCYAYDAASHNHFDIHFDYMTIEGCIANNSSLAPMQLYNSHIVVNNFTGSNGNNGIKFYTVLNVTIMNCTLDQSIYNTGAYYSSNVNVYNNYIVSAGYGVYMNSTDTTICENNEFYTSNAEYYILNGTTTIRDEVAPTYMVYSDGGANITMEYTDGKIFTENGAGSPQYYPDQSNYTFTTAATITVTSYNITLQPTNAYLKDVSVNHESDTSDDRTNISVNSSVATNPTWINSTMVNDLHNYSISVDSSIVDYVDSDSDKIVSYNYTSAWSPHTFEISWVSGSGVITIPNNAWFYTLLIGANNMTITEIKSSMDADGLDCWAAYRWTGTAFADTGTVQPCEGIVVYCNNTGEWKV